MAFRASSTAETTLERQQHLVVALSNPPQELDCTPVHSALRTIFQTYDTRAAKERYKRQYRVFEKQAVQTKVPLGQREEYIKSQLVAQLGSEAVAYRRVHLQICDISFSEKARNILRKKHEEKRSTLELAREHLQATASSLDENARKRIFMIYKDMVLHGLPVSEEVLSRIVPLRKEEDQTQMVVAVRKTARTAQFPTAIRIHQRLNGPALSPALLQFLVGERCIASYTIPYAPSQLQDVFKAIARLSKGQDSGLKRIEASKTPLEEPEQNPEDDFVLIDRDSNVQTVTTTIELDANLGQTVGNLASSVTFEPEFDEDFVKL